MLCHPLPPSPHPQRHHDSIDYSTNCNSHTPSLPPSFSSAPPLKIAFTTRALAPSTRKATPTASRAAHGFSRTSSRGGAKTGRVVRVPFLNQGLAKAAHTRLFSTTEDAAPAAAAPAAMEAEVSLFWEWRRVKVCAYSSH